MRTIGAAGGLALWASAGAIGCSDGGAAAAPPTFAEDPRLVELVAPCPTPGHFSGDTSDMIEVMVAKLETGQLEVIRHFREELVAAGDAAVPALDALVRRRESDPHGAPALRNVLGVLRLSSAASAHDVLRRCLEHRTAEVRAAAAAGLERHARREDYDALASLLPVSGPDARSALFLALHTADPARAERELADWLAAGANRDLWSLAARAVAKTAGPSSVALFTAPAERLEDIEVRPFLLAALLVGGEESALEDLRAFLAQENRTARTVALDALELADRPREMLPMLADPDVGLRVRTASLLKPVALEEWASAPLREALRDESPEVRQVALDALLSVADEEAGDHAIALLGGERAEIQTALFALRPNWDANPGLAARAFAVLRERHEALSELPLDARAHLLQAIGTVPVSEAGAFLIELARSAPDEAFHKMSVHRWLAREAGNTAPGRAVAREAWSAEGDEERRLDLLEAASFGLDDPTRAFLVEVVQSERAGPWEVLYACERLARQGPASEIAPLLKRVALRQEHPLVRPALDCLLWRWYG